MEEIRDRFNSVILNLMDNKKPNSGFMTKQKYDELIMKVHASKRKKVGKKPEDYQRLRRYDVLKLDDVEKLVVPIKDAGCGLRLYVYFEELFDIIHNTHLAVGHGGRNRMLKELQGKYKNVTAEAVMLYLSLCEYCQRKNKVARKTYTKPMVFQEVESRGQVDLIDMRLRPDKEFQYILVYQDDLTKFVQLRALKNDTPEEIAFHLIDIFTIFGAPSVLQSNDGREFCERIVKALYVMWSDLKIVHGNVNEAQNEHLGEIPSENVELMLNSWLEKNKTRTWAEGLRFMQLMKNKAFHDSIKCTPYEAMFGMPYKLGLKTTFPLDSINDVWSEEDLHAWLERYNYGNDEFIHGGSSNVKERDPLVTDDQPAADSPAAVESPPPVVKVERDPTPERSGDETSEYNQVDKSTKQKLSRNSSAEESSTSQPNKMQKVSAGDVGDTVTLRVPHVEKVMGNVQDILAVILEIQHREIYRLGTIHGKLTEWFTRDQFMICDEKFIMIEDVPDQEISLEECVRKSSLVIHSSSQRCICKGGCNSDKCKCKKSGKFCTYKCHNGLMCLNEVI